MISLLIFSLKNRKKGSLPLKTVAKIILAIMAVSLIFAGVSSWFGSMGEEFVGSVEYPG